jgi:hypothetical protein
MCNACQIYYVNFYLKDETVWAVVEDFRKDSKTVQFNGKVEALDFAKHYNDYQDECRLLSIMEDTYE